MTPKDIFLACVAGEKCTRPSAGSATSIATTDLMERTGFSFPAAHREAEAMAGLAAAGHTVLGFDNVMPLFSVWHESEALGCTVDWGHKGSMPAGRTALMDELHDLPEIPADLLDRPGCAVPLRALALLRKEFGSHVSVTGKVFGPWTLAYHVFGMENFLIATLLEPDLVRAALRHLMQVTIRFGRAQLAAGADSLTLADHCTRDLCSPEAYQEFLMPIHAELKKTLQCPILLHICGDTSDRIPFIAKTGIDCFHFDSKVAARTARQLAGNRLSLMGGTSNLTTILHGTAADIETDVLEKFRAGINILGPECAVPLDAPYANLEVLSRRVRALNERERS